MPTLLPTVRIQDWAYARLGVCNTPLPDFANSILGVLGYAIAKPNLQFAIVP